MALSSKKYIAIAAVTVLILNLWVLAAPSFFMQRSYALWQAAGMAVRAPDSPPWIILGDSRAMFGIIPQALPFETRSFAIEGTSIIDAFYILKEYLEKHPAPKKILLAVSPIRFERAEYFWENSVKSSWIRTSALFELLQAADQLHDYDFTGQRESSFFRKFKLICIRSGWPFCNRENLAYGKLALRWWPNQKTKEAWLDRRGWLPAEPDPERAHRPGREANRREFNPAPVLDAYLDRVLSLAESAGSELLFVFLPTNPASARSISSQYNSQFRTYLETKSNRHPHFQILNSFAEFPAALFADQDHLNSKGAAEFSRQLSELLRN